MLQYYVIPIAANQCDFQFDFIVERFRWQLLIDLLFPKGISFVLNLELHVNFQSIASRC